MTLWPYFTYLISDLKCINLPSHTALGMRFVSYREGEERSLCLLLTRPWAGVTYLLSPVAFLILQVRHFYRCENLGNSFHNMVLETWAFYYSSLLPALGVNLYTQGMKLDKNAGFGESTMSNNSPGAGPWAKLSWRNEDRLLFHSKPWGLL